MTDKQEREWHLDRKVTIGLIIALLAHGGATVWWASKLEERVAHIEVQQTRSLPNSERIAKVETQFELMADTINRMEQKLDRVLEYGIKR